MPIPQLSFVLFFVVNPSASAAFYSRILKLKPIEESATFAMFALPGGVMLGLWSPLTAHPPAEVRSGGSEIAFCEDDVDGLYETWEREGVPIALPPTDLGFGRTFVALDPDGHRIRVVRLTEAHA